MNHKKLIAGILAVSLMGGGAIMPGETIKTLSDSMVMNVSAAGTNYSCDSFDFDASTGTMTLKGNVNANDIKHFTQKENVKSVTAQKGTVFPSDCSDMFYEYSNVTSFDLSNVDTSNVTDMCYMFNGCSALNSLDVSSFDTSNVTNMSYMFNGCSVLTSLDVSSFDTSKVTNMSFMFNYCIELHSLDVSNFDTSNVTDISCMFAHCIRLTSLDLSNFNTSKVTNMSGMFDMAFSGEKYYLTSQLSSLDISSFDTSNVTDMSSMFSRCISLTSLDLSNFDTSKVTNMSKMFDMYFNLGSYSDSGLSYELYKLIASSIFCELTSLDISSFDTSKVTDMSDMFSGCSGLTSLDVSGFDTSNVTDMSRMFKKCYVLSPDLSSFDTSKVTNMSGMFSCYRSKTVLDLSNFDTSNVTDMSEMFDWTSYKDVPIPERFTPIDLRSFDTSKVTNMRKMFAYNLASSINLSSFILNNTDTQFMFSGAELKSIICSNGNYESIVSELSMNSNVELIETEWLKSDDIIGLTQSYNPSNIVFSRKAPAKYTEGNIEIAGTDYKAYYNETDGTLTFSGENGVIIAEGDYSGCFKDMKTLKSIDLSGLITSNITNMSNMFTGCTALERIDMSMLDTSNVQSFRTMFSACSSLKEVKLSGLITSSATNISMMFANCSSLKKVDLSNSDITNCTSLLNMFRNAPVEEIACTQAEYNTYVKNGSLKSSAVRVDKLCIADASFSTNSMSLGGSISVNFYTLLNNVPAGQLEKTYVEFTVNGKTQTAKFNADKMNPDKTKYGFTCMLNSISMADDINAVLYYYDENGVKHSTRTKYTAETYIDTAIAKSTNAKMITLAKSINDYGYYMQKYLSKTNGWTIGTDYVGMAKSYNTASAYSDKKSTYLNELSAYKKTESLNADISKVNYSLSLDSDTSINVKITPATGYTGSITATVDGNKATLTKQSDGRYALKIANIPAHELSAMHTVAIKTTKGTSTYKVSALSFAYDCINAGTSNAERYNAACALYEYYKSAKAYKG